MQEKPQKTQGDTMGEMYLPGWTDVDGGQHKERSKYFVYTHSDV